MSWYPKKPLLLFGIFALIATISAALPEMGFTYFSGYDGLGRGVLLAILVTAPASLLAFWFLLRFSLDMYRLKHPKK